MLYCELDDDDNECVSNIKFILWVIFYAIYGAVCIQLTHLCYDNCENTCTLSYCHHRIGIWSICHCLGSGHATMVCAVCLPIFLCSTKISFFHQHFIGSSINIQTHALPWTWSRAFSASETKPPQTQHHFHTPLDNLPYVHNPFEQNGILMRWSILPAAISS